MMSTQRSTLRATSATASRSPSGELVWSTKIALPPMVLKPASKLSRVRRLAFSNISTICLASRAWRYSRGLRFTSCPSFKIARVSALDRSLIEHRSSPASRAAADRISWSCSTGIAAICRSINALLATNLSSHFSGITHRSAVGVLRKNLIQCRDSLVHMFFLKNERRQESKHRIARHIDQYLALQHLLARQLRQISRVKLSRQHQPLTANIHDGLMLLRQLLQLSLEVIANLNHMCQQAFAFDRIDDRNCHRASQRSASKRSPVHTRMNRFRHFFRA